jgi:CHAT domain-containing protein/tetratricopeptide (TPR) repeat protein
LSTQDAGERTRCYDRLLAIYARLGLVDRAVQVGLRYRQLLLQGGGAPGRGTLVRLRDLDVQLGGCYLVLGHYRTAEAYLERALAEVPGLPPLQPLLRVMALTDLARCAEKRGDRARASRFWRQVEEVAREQLDRPRQVLTPQEQIECVGRLADSYRFREQPAKAIARLVPLLALHDRLADLDGKRDTLRRLAGHHAALGQDREAEKYLRQALALPPAPGPAQRIARGDLADELAEALARQKHTAEMDKWRRQAAEEYRSVLEASPGERRAEVAPVITAFWRLQKLYQKTSQYRQALQLAEDQTREWAGGALAEPKLKSEEGTLKVILGSFAQARPTLRAAVADLERQSPLNYIDLPRAFNNLAIVEQVTGDTDRAEALATKCLKLYRTQELPDDLLVVEAYNVLGSCAAERGLYALAIERFREGIARCDKLGTAADLPHSSLLLNVALLHKSQGDLAEALRALEQALVIYRRLVQPDALGFAAFDAARVSLYTAQGRLAEAYALAPHILELCRKYEIEDGPLVVTARHCEGLYHLSRGEFSAAEQAWRQVRTLLEKAKDAPLLPRTLNYLGLSAELQGRLKEAEGLYAQAEALQRDNQRAFPVTHFITLWRQAGLAERAGRRSQARRLLEEAVAVVERARLKTYGDAQQRANFFAQFEAGFEDLVDAYVRDGDVESAFAASARGRSRTLLDQLQLAGVDPRAALKGTRGAELRLQEAELRQRITALRARAQFIAVGSAQQAQVRKLLADLDEAQESYAAVWREILNASPVYRSLSAEDPSRDLLPKLRRHVLGPRTLLLAYHIGRARSYLFLLGDRSFKPEAFPLTAPAGVADRLAAVETPPTETALKGARGIVLQRKRQQPEPPPSAGPADPTTAVPLTQFVARALVDQYRGQIADPDFRATRGFVLVSRSPRRPVPPQGLELLGNVLLPPAARRRIKEYGAECLVVIPDGPLHKLPLEALLLETSPRPRYVLDELPPLVYAPSAAVLALLADRPAPTGPLSLLTVSNPAYPQPKEVSTPTASQGGSRGLLGLKGQLPLLPFTAKESENIRKFFDPDRVQQLEGPRATERAVAAAVAGKRMIHLAAHGFADDRLGNLFGALALTPPPPGRETPEDDGFLSLHEIYALPLKDCDLAVLSACVTNVGPQRPLEAGVTVASGFLAAGARRVVASHWSVDDESTAVLMAAFFKGVTAEARGGGLVRFARALQEARLKVRNTPRWSAPFYWAPFVLIGPAE